MTLIERAYILSGRYISCYDRYWRCHFPQQESFVDNIFELFGELEVQQLLNQFFDRAIYYSILEYEEEVGHDDVDRAKQEGRFIAGTSGSA